jgi:hypothetical protein
MTRITVDLDFLEANQLISAAEQHAAVLASHLERVPGVDAVLLLAAIAHTQGAVERIRAAFGILTPDEREFVDFMRATRPDLYAWAEAHAAGAFA